MAKSDLENLASRVYEIEGQLGDLVYKLKPIEVQYCPNCQQRRYVYRFVTPIEVPKYRCLACGSLIGMAVSPE